MFAGTIQVAGLDEPTGRSFRKGGPDLEKALAGYDPGRLTILLSHRPDGFDRAVRKKVDLQLSEHSHAGQIPPMDSFIWLTYAYPFGNRAAKSNYAISKISSEKSQIALESVMQDVRVDVRRSARAVESGYERVVAARKNTELQTKKLEAEQKKFDNGMSTSFEVFTFQTDLRNAQLSLIRALLDYNKSLADLERAKGTLLESKGLKLADNAGR